MKSYMIVFLILLLVNISGFSQSKWTPINYDVPNIKIYSSYVIGSTAYFWGDQNTVLKTSNGGNSFETLPPYTKIDNTTLGCCDRHGITFTDSLNGYIVDVGHGEFITSDGGRTWSMEAGTGTNAYVVEFVENGIGWKAGDGGFYKTTSGGLSWDHYSTPILDGGIVTNIFALDKDNVWILKGYTNSRKVEGSIWYSADNGTNWEQLRTGIASTDQNQLYYTDFIMKPSGEGMAIGNIYRPNNEERKAFIQKTGDFGKSWSTKEFDYSFENIQAIDDSIWIVLGMSYRFSSSYITQLRSKDKGESWEIDTLGFGEYNVYWSSAYIPKFESFLVSTGNGIYKSIDKGKTYYHFEHDLNVYVDKVVIEKNVADVSNQMVIANYDNSKFLISLDGGYTWKKKEIPEKIGYPITSIKGANGTLYSLLNYSLLYKSTDYGESWSKLNTPLDYQGIRMMDLIDGDRISINNHMYLSVSLDGGETWSKSPYPGYFHSNDMKMLNSNEVIIAGDYHDVENNKRGFIYRTDDLGYNYYISEQPSSMIKIDMIDQNIGYSISEKEVYKTIDGGDNWDVILNAGEGYSDNYSAICFLNDLVGYVYKKRDLFYMTKDGGVNWNKAIINYPFREVEDVVINKNGDLIVANNGNLLRYSDNQANQNTNQNISNITLEEPELYQNFPNPFNPTTQITVSIPKSGMYTLRVYNVLGQEVATLLSDQINAGTYTFNFDASKLTTGIYFYNFSGLDFIQTRKMLLIK